MKRLKDIIEEEELVSDSKKLSKYKEMIKDDCKKALDKTIKMILKRIGIE